MQFVVFWQIDIMSRIIEYYKNTFLDKEKYPEKFSDSDFLQLKKYTKKKQKASHGAPPSLDGGVSPQGGERGGYVHTLGGITLLLNLPVWQLKHFRCLQFLTCNAYDGAK